MTGREAVSALALLLVLFCGTPGARAEEQATEEMPFPAGMTSVGHDLQEAAEVEGALELDELIPALADTPTLDLNADYAVLLQKADSSLSDESSAFGGVLRLYGSWTISGRGTIDTGSIVGKVEHRHGIGSYLAPGDLTQQLGYLGITGTGFTDVGLFLGPLFWKQYSNDAHAVVVVGRLNPPDFVDLLGVGSQWNSFLNAAALVNLTVAVPDVGLGAGGGVKLSDQWVIGASLHDANGSPTEIDWLVDGTEFFKQVYASWTPTRAQRYTNALHLIVWHADERETRGLEESHGVAVSGNWLIGERWMPFARWGSSQGDAPVARQQFTAGVLINVARPDDQLGIAAWWQDLSHRGLDDQSGVEVFYRWQVRENLAITPSAQFLRDPALNPDDDRITLLGLRVRALL